MHFSYNNYSRFLIRIRADSLSTYLIPTLAALQLSESLLETERRHLQEEMDRRLAVTVEANASSMAEMDNACADLKGRLSLSEQTSVQLREERDSALRRLAATVRRQMSWIAVVNGVLWHDALSLVAGFGMCCTLRPVPCARGKFKSADLATLIEKKLTNADRL